MMSRRSNGGGDGPAVDEGQNFGPEVLFSRSGVSPPRLEHGETRTAALVATFLVTYGSYKRAVRREAGDGLSDAQPSCRRLWTWCTSGCLVYAVL